MTLKKTLIIFVVVYGLIGLYSFCFKEEPKSEPAAKTDMMKVELEWDVTNELNGNYRTPIWLKNPEYNEYVEEVEYSDDEALGEPEFTSAYQLMSLFAQLQLGDPTIASSFVNPDISHADYDSKKVADIIDGAESFADRITKNTTLRRVSISPPIKQKDDLVSHDVILQFSSGNEITIRNIPMIMLREDHGGGEHVDSHDMWYMNLNLLELAQRVEKKE